MLKRPPLGKLSLASKRGRAHQLLDREQRERDRRDLLSSVGKNSLLAASSCSGQDTPSRNERYAARVASIGLVFILAGALFYRFEKKLGF